MPKRKRSVEETIQNKLEKYRIDLFRALGSAKAAERKRFSSRLREPEITSEKKARLQREYDLLKTLDLRQTARNHLYSNLLRIKAVEASNALPEDVRAGVPKSTLSQEEIALQNNVISVLCNTGPAKKALDSAVAGICEALGVPVAVKSKRVRKNRRQDAEEQPSDRILSPDGDEDEDTVTPAPKAEGAEASSDEGSGEETDFEGFDSDADEPGSDVVEPNELAESDEEAALSKYVDLLGGSSDDEDEEEFDEELLAKYRGREQVNLDDISLSGSASDVEDDGEEELLSEAESRSPSPPPTKRAKSEATNSEAKVKEKTKAEKKDSKVTKEEKKNKAAKAAAKASRPGDSTFLPSLMGGYISGSESASDIDAPPKKNRRGQRARQAIWEKKYGVNARHLKKEAGKGNRDAGWDMRRGAVGPEDQGKGKPWKKGGDRMPPRRDNNRGPQMRDNTQEHRPRPEPRKPPKKDNEGPLHPSWEARKKAKESEKGIAFSGQKIVFD